MNKPQFGWQAKPRRPKRRLMTELTASLESGVVVQESSRHTVATATVEDEDWARRVTNEQAKEAEQVAATHLSLNKNLSCSTRESHWSDEGASAAASPPSSSVNAAEAHGTNAIDLMTANLHATLEYLQRLAKVRSPVELVELSTDHARKHLGLIIENTAAFGELSKQLMRPTLGTAEYSRDKSRGVKTKTRDP
jgi:hypothetical protein